MKKEMFKRLIISSLALFMMSCSNDDDSPSLNRLLGKTFVFPLVQSQIECDDAQQNSTVFNCAQYITFETNERANVIFTDIANDARYTINENSVTITIEEPEAGLNVESPLIFTINDASNVLTRISNNSNAEWKLEIDGIAPWDL